MPALYLTESEVAQLLNMRLTIDVLEEAFRRLASGEATNVVRSRACSPGIVLHTMCAAAQYLNIVGWKAYTTTKQGAKFLVGLCNASNGEMLALMEADRLGQMRTGATTGVAVEWLAAPEISELGMIGTGWQAETQLAAVAAVRPLQRAFVYSREAERREMFAQNMSARLNLEVLPVDRPDEAVSDLPLVITATSSAEPVLSGEWLAEGTLVCAIGSNWRGRAELDSTTIRRADNVVCDSVDCCRQEAGDFTQALENGVFDWNRAVNLCDVVSGQAVGRNTRDSVVLFKSVGLAIEDVALGAAILELARHRGLGTPLPF